MENRELPYLVDALLGVLHGVLVFQGLGIQSREVKDKSERAIFFMTQNSGPAWLNYSNQPFGDILLHLMTVSVGIFNCLK